MTVELGTILIFAIAVVVVYNTVEDFHNWADKNVLNKEVMQDTSTTIELEENAKVYAFNKNIAVLSKNKFKIYNNFGNKDAELDVEITNPLFSSSNRFVAIGEKLGQKVYVVEDKNRKDKEKLQFERKRKTEHYKRQNVSVLSHKVYRQQNERNIDRIALSPKR